MGSERPGAGAPRCRGRRRGRLALALLVLCASCSRSDASPGDEGTAETSAAEVITAEVPPPDLDDHAFPLLIWAAHTVQTEYFDKARIDPVEQLDAALVQLGIHTPAFFAEYDEGAKTFTVRVASASAEFPADDLDSLRMASERLEEILEFTQKVLDLEPEPLHELEYAAINGLFAPLDPHTILLTPEEHADLGVRTKGEFGGIGAEIRAERRRIVVERVLPRMPAEVAGLRAGDVLTRIGGQSTVNMTASEAQSLLRGPVGTTIEMKVRRGKATLTVEVERDTIRIDSVTSALLPGGIAYLRISTFQENTADQVREALTSMGAADGKLEGVVIDLRGNSGGLLVQATAVIDQLVSRGELVIVRSALGREADPATEGTLLPPDASVVALVDEESASAAEIVSGGIKALGRGVVIGRSSFGKGTVQVVRPASPYGRELALKMTIAEYLVAGDRRIQTSGVVPDLELHPVELTRIPGVVRYYDLERFERLRERARVAHLPSARHELAGANTSASVAHVRYLWNDELPSQPEGSPAPPDELRDPEVRIAAAVASSVSGATDPEARVAAVETAASRIAMEEDARISEALAETKVDWTVSPAIAGAPKLEVRSELAKPGPILAGDAFALRVMITNHGSEPVHRVHAITDCVHDELDGIELMLGTIGAGDTAVRDVNLRVMPWHSDFTDALAIAVHAGEPDDEPDAKTKVMFEIEGASRPSLSYDVWVVDDPKWATDSPRRPPPGEWDGDQTFDVTGNGDGVLQPGEKVLIAFSTRNDGPGESPAVRAMLRNLSGRQGLLEEGLVELGAIAAGATKSGAFGLSIRTDADPTLPLELELVVGDVTLRTSAEDKLRLRVLERGPTLEPEPGAFEVRGEPIRLYAGAHASSQLVSEVPVGTQLQAVGKMGGWRMFETADKSRRFFAPADLEALAALEGQAKDGLADLTRRRAVLPPAIEVGRFPRLTSAAVFTIEGAAVHPVRIRDVVVLVRPPGAAAVERKVHYESATGDVKRLPFTAQVPLEPGGNRVTILARDGAKVQHRRDLWVYRDAE